MKRPLRNHSLGQQCSLSKCPRVAELMVASHCPKVWPCRLTAQGQFLFLVSSDQFSACQFALPFWETWAPFPRSQGCQSSLRPCVGCWSKLCRNGFSWWFPHTFRLFAESQHSAYFLLAIWFLGYKLKKKKKFSNLMWLVTPRNNAGKTKTAPEAMDMRDSYLSPSSIFSLLSTSFCCLQGVFGIFFHLLGDLPTSILFFSSGICLRGNLKLLTAMRKDGPVPKLLSCLCWYPLRSCPSRKLEPPVLWLSYMGFCNWCWWVLLQVLWPHCPDPTTFPGSQVSQDFSAPPLGSRIS